MGLLVLLCFLCFGCVGSIFGEKLYGVNSPGRGAGVTFIQYDSDCSTTKNVSYFSDLYFHEANRCAFDQDKGIMYIFADSTTIKEELIYGISVTTGEILSTASPPATIPGTPQIAFDSNSGQLIFTAKDFRTGLWQQFLLDPTTGEGPIVNSVDAGVNHYSSFIGVGTGFDPINSIQWIPIANLEVGAVQQFGFALNGSTYLLSDPNAGSTPVYSGDSDGTMYSWGYSKKRLTEKWTFTDTEPIVVADVQSSWETIFNGVNAYSTETDTMYSVLDNGRPDVDYFLVGIDVNTGATKSAVFLNEAVWPWCLGYVNDN